MSKNDLVFKRKEKKYLILEHTFDEIIEELSEHIPIQIYKGKSCISGIETTYLDTEDFLLFNEYLARRSFRYKIRLRRYRIDGVYENNYLVELKVKNNKISSKRRFILPAKLLNEFLAAGDIKDQIKEANKGLTGAVKTYRIITKLIESNKFVPVLRSTYDRIAFQKKTKRLRVTVDHNVMHEKLLGKSSTATLDAVILESKISGKTPKWYKRLVNQLSLLRQERFSKFTTGINSLYFPERGKYNFYDELQVTDEMPVRIHESMELINKLIRLD